MKNFKYKLAITNYDQGLIGWCVGIGMKVNHIHPDKKTFSYLVTGYFSKNENLFTNVEEGFIRCRYKDNYRIDYKEHPELTKALLAAVNDNYLHGFEYFSVKEYRYQPNRYIVMINDRSQELKKPYYKLIFTELINHFSCKLSGKEIVSKEEKKQSLNDTIKDMLGFDLKDMSELTDLATMSQFSFNQLLDRLKELKDLDSHTGPWDNFFKDFDMNDLNEHCESCPCDRCYEVKDKRKAYQSRLRTERDRITDKINTLFDKGKFITSDQKYIGRLFENVNNINKKLNRELLSFTFDEKEFEKTINSIGMPYEMGGLNFIPNDAYGNLLGSINLKNQPESLCSKTIEKLVKDAQKLSRTKIKSISSSMREFAETASKLAEILHKSKFKTKDGKDIAHLVETAQELGKSKKATFTKPDFDKSFEPKKNESLNELIEKLKKFNMKEVKFTCENKDCDSYNIEKKSNCDRLFPDIYNDSKPVCRDYKENKNRAFDSLFDQNNKHIDELNLYRKLVKKAIVKLINIFDQTPDIKKNRDARTGILETIEDLRDFTKKC